MGHITYCLMCLGTEMKMYPMNTTMIRIYNELISYSKKRNFTERYACYECGYLLLKYDNFKRKCHRAYNIIYSLSPNSLQIPEDLLNSIDREQNKLTTSMCSWTMSYNYEPKEQEFESEEEVKADLSTFDNDEINNEDDPLEAMEEQAVYLEVKNSSETDEDEQRSLYCKSEPDCTDDHEPDSNLDYKPDSNLDCKLLDDKNTIEHDIEDDYQFTQTFKVESSNYKPNSGSMLWLTIESKENTELFDNEPHTGSTIQSFDNKNAMALPYLVIDKRDTRGKKLKKGKKAVSKKIKKKKEKVNKANGKHIVLKPLQKRKIIHHEFRKKSLPDDIIKEYMTLIELTPEEVKKEFLLRKNSSNYTNNPFKCNLCYKGFISNNSYQTHMKKHSLKYGEFQCDICKLCYDTRARLKKHVWVHKRKYSCNKCPYICFNQSQFYGHIMSHTDKKYQCDKCDSSYRFQNSLLTHMQIKHGGENVCDFCGSTFASEKGLALHKLMLHKQEENERLGPRCDECDVHFASELAWKRHRVLCSRHQVQFGCRVCGEEFPNAEILRSHTREHEPTEKKRKYLTRKCRFCKRAVPNKEALRKHLEKKHPNEYARCKLSESEAGRYICEICGKACKKTSSLIMHQRTHTNEMPYVCPECGLRYKYKQLLKQHLRAHGDQPAFHCDLCGRQYAEKKGLVRHMRLHLNIRPYKCVACDKSFLYRSDERTHYRHVHEKVPYPKKNVCPEEKRRKPFPRSRVQIFDL